MTCYQLDPAELWNRVRLDDMDALYHRVSGQTHILIEPAPQIFDCLLDGPATVQQISERLMQQFVYEQEEEDQGAISVNALLHQRLEEMVALGFVSHANVSAD